MEVLETDRLVLEPWDQRHRAQFQRICRDPQVMRFIGPGRTWSSAEADEVFDLALAHWHEHGFGWRSILERAGGEWLGFIGLNHPRPGAIEMAPDEVEFGWWLVRRAWGRGIATEGATAVRDEAFGPLGLDRILARVQPPNAASTRVVQKLGMEFQRDAVGRHGEAIRIYVLERPHPRA
jgi:RimJ/RimL family protein N-acetyltransferase